MECGEKPSRPRPTSPKTMAYYITRVMIMCKRVEKFCNITISQMPKLPVLLELLENNCDDLTNTCLEVSGIALEVAAYSMSLKITTNNLNNAITTSPIAFVELTKESSLYIRQILGMTKICRVLHGRCIPIIETFRNSAVNLECEDRDKKLKPVEFLCKILFDITNDLELTHVQLITYFHKIEQLHERIKHLDVRKKSIIDDLDAIDERMWTEQQPSTSTGKQGTLGQNRDLPFPSYCTRHQALLYLKAQSEGTDVSKETLDTICSDVEDTSRTNCPECLNLPSSEDVTNYLRELKDHLCKPETVQNSDLGKRITSKLVKLRQNKRSMNLKENTSVLQSPDSPPMTPKLKFKQDARDKCAEEILKRLQAVERQIRKINGIVRKTSGGWT